MGRSMVARDCQLRWWRREGGECFRAALVILASPDRRHAGDDCVGETKRVMCRRGLVSSPTIPAPSQITLPTPRYSAKAFS